MREINDAAAEDEIGLGTRFAELFAGVDATGFELPPRDSSFREINVD